MLLTGSEVLEKTRFLNGCLVPRNTFLHATREKAWGKYHQAYLRQLPSTMELTNSAHAAAWLCLRSFEKLIDVNYPLYAEAEQLQLSEQNKDVVHFIGGSVLQKLKQRLVQRKDCTAKEEKLRCIEDMLAKEADEEADGEASLTNTLNRAFPKTYHQGTVSVN